MALSAHAFVTMPNLVRHYSILSQGVLPNAQKVIPLRTSLSKMTAAASETAGAFSTRGMTVEDFFAKSVGTWKSLRSSHNIAFGQIEEVNSNIEISDVSADDAELQKICEIYKADPKSSCSSVR
jgi:hypothetical protein